MPRPGQDVMSHIFTGTFLQPFSRSVLVGAGTHGDDEKITLHGLKLEVAQGELLGICGEVRPAIFLASMCNFVLYAVKVHQVLSCLFKPISDPDHPSCTSSGLIVGLFSTWVFLSVPNCCMCVGFHQRLNTNLLLAPHSQTEFCL